MSLSVGGLAQRATPVANGDFVVVNIAASLGANLDLVAAIRTAVTAVGVGLTPTRNYPSTWKGLLIASNTTAVQIMTDNGTATTAAGINIPVGQSLYLPYENAAAAGLEYTSVAALSVGVFF